MGEHIVVIDPEGVLYSVWSDALTGLYEVEKGGVEVERASHVEFCQDCLGWHIWAPDALVQWFERCSIAEAVLPIYLLIKDAFKTRECALLYEREEIERRLQG